MAYCKECGTELREKAKFCPNCGARIIPEAPKAAEEPKTKPTKIEVTKVEKADPTSRLMTDLKFGVVFIVIGFLTRLLIVDIIAKKTTDSALIPFGNWFLILFVTIGIYLVWVGIADYVITRKNIEPPKMIINLKVGVAFILVGFLARLFITNVASTKISDLGTINAFGNFLLILFVIIGLLIIGFGIAEYAIAKKRK